MLKQPLKRIEHKKRPPTDIHFVKKSKQKQVFTCEECTTMNLMLWVKILSQICGGSTNDMTKHY